jgi:hypothetical protein
MKNWIAERELRYSDSGSDSLKQLFIRVGEPYLLEEGMVDFQFTDGTAGCSVRFEGFEEEYLDEVYGADPLQALELAVNGIEPTIKRLSKKYDFFFPTGEPYFDDEEK